jgi:DNA-binding XRE family transcriptional regulator
MVFLPVQCRMARAALGLGVRELATAAKVARDTIVRFERGDELKERTVDAIRDALVLAGVEFTNGDRPGVRLSAKVAAKMARANAPTSPDNPPREVGEKKR